MVNRHLVREFALARVRQRVGGRAQARKLRIPAVGRQLEGGKLRIEVTSDQRLAGSLAAIPTWQEQGVAGTFNTWRGPWGPKGMSAEQVAFQDDALERISRDELWKENPAANLRENGYRSSRDTLRYLDALHVEMRDVLKEPGLAKKLD